MLVVPYIPSHLSAIVAREDANLEIGLDGNIAQYAKNLFFPGLCYTALSDRGTILGSGGIVPQHHGLGEAWALFSVEQKPGASRKWLFIDQQVRLFLSDNLGKRFHRIQTVVKSDFLEGHIWVKRLGFSDPVPLDNWGPEREDFDLYRMVA